MYAAVAGRNRKGTQILFRREKLNLLSSHETRKAEGKKRNNTRNGALGSAEVYHKIGLRITMKCFTFELESVFDDKFTW